MVDRSQPSRDSELNQVTGFLLARWKLIAASVVAAVGAAVLFASWQEWFEDVPAPRVPAPAVPAAAAKPPTYAATAVYNAEPSRGAGLEPGESVAIGRHLASTYQFILGTRSVAQLLVDHLELDIDSEQVQSALTVASSPDLTIITVTATGDDPAMVLAMDNGVGEALANSSATVSSIWATFAERWSCSDVRARPRC